MFYWENSNLCMPLQIHSSIWSGPAGLARTPPRPRSEVLSYILHDGPITAQTGGEATKTGAINISRQTGQIWWWRSDRGGFKQRHQQPVCVYRDPDGYAAWLEPHLNLDRMWFSIRFQQDGKRCLPLSGMLEGKKEESISKCRLEARLSIILHMEDTKAEFLLR